MKRSLVRHSASMMSQPPESLFERKAQAAIRLSVVFLCCAHDNNAGAQTSIMICQNCCPILQIREVDGAEMRAGASMDSTKTKKRLELAHTLRGVAFEPK
jgi:hypothetical protein